MQLRADLHLHTNLDPVDGTHGRRIVRYTPQQLFAVAQKQGLAVLALSHHNLRIFSSQLAKQAKKYDITLIPALEATIEGSHVVILNPSKSTYATFAQLTLEKRRNPNCFIYAPHPFYPGGTALREKLLKNITLFDGIEYCHFYLSFFNIWNKKAVALAKKYNKTIVGTSDAHDLRTIGSTYTVVESKSRQMKDIIAALKQPARVSVVTKPVAISDILRVLANITRTIAYFLKLR